jgi:hypothetical protein
MRRLWQWVQLASLWVAARFTALDLGARDAEFYGGLLLIGFGPGRLVLVGWVLVAHAWLTPMLIALTERRA